MALTLAPDQASRLFLGIEAQQQSLLRAMTTRPGRHTAPLPACPACGTQPDEITVAVDDRTVRFPACSHTFTLSREALTAGLRATAR